MTVTVRRAGPEDAPALAEVHVRSWRAGYRGVVPDEHLDGLSVSAREARWLEKFAANAGTEWSLWIAEEDGRPVGFSDCGPSRDEDDDPATVGEITTFYFLPEAWGTGTARTLMETVLQRMRGRGFSECTLWVLRDNPRAVGFYERAGFARNGAEKAVRIGGKPLTEDRYRRPLGKLAGERA